MSTGKTAIVTGASSGIGFEVCRQLAEKGWKVYGCSRRGTAPAGVTGIALDVTDEPAVQKAFAAAAEEAGGIDLLINNAGFGISGAINHTAGFAGSGLVIAVNNDPEAPIFGVADYGIVGDMDEVCDAMIAALKAK